VTGGASGLGRAIVERFAAEGAVVVVLDRDAAKLASFGDAHGGRGIAVRGDVTRLADHPRAGATALERFGRLGPLLADAGIFDFGMPLVDLPDDTIDDAFDELFAINVKGYLLAAKAALPALVESRGSIVLTLSSAATHAGCGGPLYTASKHAAVGLVRELA